MATISTGFDLFETVPESWFLFTNALPIPADFFSKGSAPFIGVIHYEGVPIREFTDPRTEKAHATGTADTVILRKQDVNIKTPGSGSTPIELVRLSVRSTSPLKIQVGRRMEQWDAYMAVSRSKPSTGTLTITQTAEDGGHFASSIHVVPHFRFERRSDGEVRELDMGALSLPEEKQKLLVRQNTMEASEVPWAVKAPENSLAIHALSANFAVRAAVFHGHGHVMTQLA